MSCDIVKLIDINDELGLLEVSIGVLSFDSQLSPVPYLIYTCKKRANVQKKNVRNVNKRCTIEMAESG